MKLTDLLNMSKFGLSHIAIVNDDTDTIYVFNMADDCFLNSDKRFSKKLSNLSFADQNHYIHNTPLYVQSLNYNAVKHTSAARPIDYLMIHVSSTPK